MPNEITLTKVSDSQIKKSGFNRAVYISDTGITLTFMYNKDGYIEKEVDLTYTNN